MQDTLNTCAVGQKAEHRACQYLQTQGLKLLTQNYRCYLGEIDLIMQDQGEIIFIEVRTRNNTDYGSAVESITTAKQKKIVKTATYYLQQRKLYDKVNCRFDVVGVEDKIEWLKNAFSLDYF